MLYLLVTFTSKIIEFFNKCIVVASCLRQAALMARVTVSMATHTLINVWWVVFIGTIDFSFIQSEAYVYYVTLMVVKETL